MLDSGNYGILRTDGKLDTSSVTITASFLAKLASITSFLTIVTVYIIGASTSPLPFWPLSTISVYGSTLPAAYFFRAGFITTGNLIVLLAMSMKKRRNFKCNYVLLLVAGFCLLSCAAISCAENNNVHSTFAIFFFLLVGIFQLSIAFKLNQMKVLTIKEKKLKHTAAFAGTYVVTEILIVILMGIGVLDLPKHIILPSFEWSGVIVILFFLYYFGDYVGKENIEC